MELSILDFIREHFSSSFMDRLMPFFSSFADDGIFWIMLAFVLISSRKWDKAGKHMLYSLLVNLLIVNICVKPFFARIRPYDVNKGVTLLIDKLSDYSFPSGHTAASFAAAFSLKFTKVKGWIPALILACIIAFSRLYLYVHYPTDVLFGALFGTASALIADSVCRKCER